MNCIIWNCRGASKPSFQKRVKELVHNHNPAILVVMETRVGGNRAREITESLPFDEAIRSDAIGFAGGVWVLWNSDRVDVAHLASTEQEIHCTVKVRTSNVIWLLSAVYASPRSAERHILWNNLMKVAELHNMSWVIAGDFNEPLLNDDKFGGRAVSTQNTTIKSTLEAILVGIFPILVHNPKSNVLIRWPCMEPNNASLTLTIVAFRILVLLKNETWNLCFVNKGLLLLHHKYKHEHELEQVLWLSHHVEP
ncbi:hypothetical protein CFP56_023809 [Quercus suber]|uniref:Endonuclease/exonuclease/phosphatase domain-containing protein n=1 Tax=Quercus suber TaxID=58331 RepID=A0AAW0K8R2_QUESU